MKFICGDVFTAEIPKADLVYADPPYANCRFKYARGNSSRQWGKNARADYMRELIARMDSLRTPEGMCALSMATPELRLLHLFPTTARVCGWFKSYAPMRPGVWPCFAWEPMVIWGRFVNRHEQRGASTPFDWCAFPPKVPRRKSDVHKDHETPKPEDFAAWVIDVTLGPRRGRVVELFAGTAPVARVAETLGCEAVAVDLEDYRRIGLFDAEVA